MVTFRDFCRFRKPFPTSERHFNGSATEHIPKFNRRLGRTAGLFHDTKVQNLKGFPVEFDRHSSFNFGRVNGNL